MHIYPNDEFDVGRPLIQDALKIEDRCLSTHHLNIRCVVYGDDDDSNVAPLVYIRILSGNSARLRKHELHEPDDGIDIGRSSGDILLNFGDSIQLTDQVEMEFCSVEGQMFTPPAVTEVQRAEIRTFRHEYRLTPKVLGVGGYAAVYVAEKADNGQQFACKIVAHPAEKSANAAQQNERRKVAREYTILAKLSHPNIISLEQVFRAPHHDYILQELIAGGDLLSYLERKGHLTEPQGAVIVRQLLEAVKYLHDHQVVHRDIKPENILVTSWRDGARVVLTDFGQARTMDDIEHAAKKAGVFRMQTLVGTVGYTAPEVYAQLRKDLQQNAGYSQAVDIWSVGCVAGTVLTSELTFPDDAELRAGKIDASHFSKHLINIDSGREWRHIGHRAKSFVKSCLATEEGKRLSAAECLNLPWFQHSHYKREFDAAYQRAIADWKPRVQDHDLIRTIDTSELNAEGGGQGKDTRSRFFARSRSCQDGMLARFRPNSLCASPVEVPESPPRHTVVAGEDPQFLNVGDSSLLPRTTHSFDDDDLDDNLDLATQNQARNAAFTEGHRPLQAAAFKRKAVYR
ncbi:hypothetical protein DOTSEDRAFT_173274 [Dothistroma septosporum NZE10]|uniref:Protein kinase domain-containing protein n=1 Tax=Dothistroma septosporum (strain NZE10 / CBS 128990) TaxID=675120 RepID=M2XK09_DOTSN|nr:hypothetical protein DOTSEDRAFT_173274 [Dothistroma septosporum NZE10]